MAAERDATTAAITLVPVTLPGKAQRVNITIDQAVQFIVSCGVVVPPEQLSTLADGREVDAINAVRRPAPALAHEVAAES